MICTAPCKPPCGADAAFIVRTKAGSLLGFNCVQHVPKQTAKDYDIAALPPDQVLEHGDIGREAPR